ncbi:MAG TPA: hypothetical protein VFS51_09660, partial [Gemmatimonadales bacterium]|nr:hypothetical protein [Gemmatimonadales bacterium]
MPVRLQIQVALLTIGVALGSATAAHAQAIPTDGLTGRLDPETAAAVRSVIASATIQGVPGEPLAAKALEGQSKGATSDRIVLAVRNLALDLTAARRALGSTASSSEIVAGAGALRAGASSDVLSRLKTARGTHSVLLPLATLTDLVARGVPVNDAAQTVLALADRGAAEADYRAHGVNAGAP